MKNKLLVISGIGCGPPFHGNRARLRILLTELKNLHYEIHFAGVCLEPEEKKATMPYVDCWVWDFSPPRRPSLWDRVRDGLRGQSGVYAGMVLRQDGAEAPDRWMHTEWLDQAARLQQNNAYDAVLVEYIFYSAFLECFDGSLRILDTHDVFADRKRRLQEYGVTDYWFSTTMDGERYGINRADRILAIQDEEAGYFRRITTAPKTVFTVGHISPCETVPFPATSRLCLGYLASDNAINRASIDGFLATVWPLLCSRFDNLTLVVAGSICHHLAAADRVEVLGEIKMVRDFYANIHLTINPIVVGTGLKIKTIESLSWGRVALCSSVACEGLGDFIDKGLFVTDSYSDYAQYIERYCESMQECVADGKQATAILEALNVSWRSELRAAFAA